MTSENKLIRLCTFEAPAQIHSAQLRKLGPPEVAFLQHIQRIVDASARACQALRPKPSRRANGSRRPIGLCSRLRRRRTQACSPRRSDFLRRGDRAGVVVFDGAERACVHTTRVRRSRARPSRCSGTGRASYSCAGSARPGSAGAVLCRGVPQTARSRSELQRCAQHPEAAALHSVGLLVR